VRKNNSVVKPKAGLISGFISSVNQGKIQKISSTGNEVLQVAHMRKSATKTLSFYSRSYLQIQAGRVLSLLAIHVNVQLYSLETPYQQLLLLHNNAGLFLSVSKTVDRGTVDRVTGACFPNSEKNHH
jgi:hypothetical protein